MLAEELLPVFDVSDELAVVVDAPAALVWQALTETDLIALGRDHPIIGMLGALRAMPELFSHALHGEPSPRPPERLTLRDLTELPISGGGWVLLGERPGEELALGLVGKFWKPIIEYAAVDAREFTSFSEPGWAKTVYALAVLPLDDGRTLLRAAMRTATTDAHARRWFRRYWMLGVGSGAHALVHGLIQAVREDAEHRYEERSAEEPAADATESDRARDPDDGPGADRRGAFSADSARWIGEQLGVDWSRSRFDVEQFRIGLGVELEHGRRDPDTNVTDDDELTTGRIALAHLHEFPDYYTRLAGMEAEAELYWASRSPTDRSEEQPS